MAVRVSGDPTSHVESREILFSTLGYLRGNGRPQYDVGPGDDRFVLLRVAETNEGGG